MSIAQDQPPVLNLYRMSVEQYHAMIEQGILTPEDRAELLEGVLYLNMSKNPPHVYAARKVADMLTKVVQADCFVSRQDPITLIDSEPEPDCCVISGSSDDYSAHHPTGDDVLMVVEASDSSLRIDQTIKLRSYARAGIAVYWIVNLIDRVIEVYTLPEQSEGTEATYKNKKVYAANDRVEIAVNGQVVGHVLASDLLP